MPGRGAGGAPCQPVESRSRDEDPDHLPEISASSVAVQSLMRKRTEPTAWTTRFQARPGARGPPPPLPAPLSRECCCFLKRFPRPAHLSDVPETPQGRPGHCLPQTLAAGAGQGGCPPYWKPERETFSGGTARAVFSPKKWGGEGEPGNGHPPCTLGCFSHLSRQYNNERELGNFQRGN